MFKGGANVEIEGGKLSLEEQLALAEAAERAKQEAEALAQKEAEEAWNKYKAEQLALATAKASTLTASVYGLGGSLVPGAFALTASGSSYNKMFVPTLVKANISPLISPTGKRFMRRCERVN